MTTKRSRRRNNVIGYVKIDIGESKGVTTPVLRKGGKLCMRNVTFGEYRDAGPLRITISIGKKHPYAHLQKYRPNLYDVE